MAFAEIRRASAAHKYTFRVSSIDGSEVRVLWEGDAMGEAEREAEKHAREARMAGSSATISLDSFRLDLERRWVERRFVSRPPSVTPIRRNAGKKGRPRVLFVPMEFGTWTNGAHSWSYAAALAYEAGLVRAGCEVTTINTALAPHHLKLLRGRRFDQVWIHCHPRHLDDYGFQQWLSDIAPVRLLLCGESVHYTAEKIAAEPWSEGHTKTFQRWSPFVTHAAFVDPADLAHAPAHVRARHWPQAVPERFVLPVNPRPTREHAVFVGTLYPPRDRWLWALDGLLERVESPESDGFQWLFERSHEWAQRFLDRLPDPRGIGPGPTVRYASAWKAKIAHKAYNRLQVALRRHAFGNFIGALRDGVATVALPSMVQTYSGRIFEGIAAGRPVIAQRLAGDHPALFEDGREILHYRDVDELQGHIQYCKELPSRANEIAAAARARLLAHHTVEVRTAELLRFTEGA